MAFGFAIYDRAGRQALTGIARNIGDAKRAVDIVADPTRGPYRVERMPISSIRAEIEAWQANATTDKAVDLTSNAGWDEL